jgi:DNA-binding transcriptional LysR family regulator
MTLTALHQLPKAEQDVVMTLLDSINRTSEVRSKIDLNTLETATVTIAEGSMSQAAARLGLTQSAVSQAIKRAEVWLGVDLIYRDSRPFIPTKAGQTLLDQLPQIQNSLEQMVENVRAASAAPERSNLRLGMIDTFASTVGPLLLRELIDGALALQLSALSGLAPAQADAMKQHAIDAAITSEDLSISGDIDEFPLFREPFVFVCPAHKAQELGNRTLADVLKTNRLIHYSARSHMGRQVDRHLRRVGCEQARVLAFDSSDSLLAMVASDVGVAISTPLAILQGGIHQSGIAVLPLPGPGFSRKVSLFVRRGELTTLGPKIASISRDLIRAEILPRFINHIPWLANQTEEMILE